MDKLCVRIGRKLGSGIESTMKTLGQIRSSGGSLICRLPDSFAVIALGLGVHLLPFSMGQHVLAGQPEAAVERAANLVVTENRKPGRNRLAVDPRPRRPGRLPLALDRRLLLEAERQGRRDDRHHGLDATAAAVPDRDLPHGLLRRAGRAAR